MWLWVNNSYLGFPSPSDVPLIGRYLFPDLDHKRVKIIGRRYCPPRGVPSYVSCGLPPALVSWQAVPSQNRNSRGPRELLFGEGRVALVGPQAPLTIRLVPRWIGFPEMRANRFGNTASLDKRNEFRRVPQDIEFRGSEIRLYDVSGWRSTYPPRTAHVTCVDVWLHSLRFNTSTSSRAILAAFCLGCRLCT